MADAKKRLLEAAEHLFARNGVHGTRVRDLNALANQRNSSSLHYHFGSREGLLQAIVERHSGPINADRVARLATLQEPDCLRDLVTVIIAPLAEELSSSSGRDYLRIVPQTADGPPAPTPPAALVMAMQRADACLSGLPPVLRRKGLVQCFSQRPHCSALVLRESRMDVISRLRTTDS